jgi:hypothetical protein
VKLLLVANRLEQHFLFSTVHTINFTSTVYGHSEISIEYSLFIIVPLIRSRARMEQTGLIETSANVGIRSGNQDKQKAYRKNRAKNVLSKTICRF